MKTRNQLADVLTKELNGIRFYDFVGKLRIVKGECKSVRVKMSVYYCIYIVYILYTVYHQEKINNILVV